MSGIKHRKKKSKSRSRSKSLIGETSDDIRGDSQVLTDEKKFKVKVSKIMGRYMVSNKDIYPGEVIISEKPLVVGPCSNCKVQCIGCYKILENEKSFVKCRSCQWPLCSHYCPGLKIHLGHTEAECRLLKNSNSGSLLNYDDFKSISIDLQAIVPLRCLILKNTNPSTYKILLDMEHHNEIRKRIPEIWNGNQTNVVDRIILDWGLTQYTEEEIHTICGILEVNCFEIGQQGVNIRGVYPTAFLMAHDCVPNTNHIDEEEDFQLTVRASTKIPFGHPITLSYAYTLQNTQKRREHLLENKFFECMCARCSDPTELGTYASALICPKCRTGLVFCDDPLNSESSWSCTNPPNCCPGYSVTSTSMTLLINRITQDVDQIDPTDVNAMEGFLSKYRNVLHPNHYLCLGVKISLSQLYGKASSFLIYELSKELLERKRDICSEILKVFDKIEPGYTRIRGVTLYEIHAPMMMLLTRDLQNQKFSKNELKTRLKEVVRCLLEASVILGYEPENSPEGVMGKAAKEALSQIKDWEKIVGKL